MSSKADDSDGNTRAPRRSLRRLASTESLSDLESRADTPVLQGRSKLDPISENEITPSNSGRPIVDTPRYSRKSVSSSSVPASPYRRTTRAMSQEKDVAASPLPKRTTRRSAMSESENDDVVVIVDTTPVKTKSARKKRQSMISSPTVHLIKEEGEEDEQNVELGCLDETLINELELRTRSISKSPSVQGTPPKTSNQSPHTSLNGSSKTEEIDSGTDILNKSETQSKLSFFKNRNKEGTSKSESVLLGDEDLREYTQEPSPIKQYKCTKRLSVQVTRTVFTDVEKKLTKSAEQKTSKVKPIAEDIIESSQMTGSLKDTPIRGRRSIREGGSSSEDQTEAKVTELLKDFVQDDDNQPKTPQMSKKISYSGEKTPRSILDESEQQLFCYEETIPGTPLSSKKNSFLTDKTPLNSKDQSKQLICFDDDEPKTPAKKTPHIRKKASRQDFTEILQKTPKTAENSTKTPDSVQKTPKTEEKQSHRTPNNVKTPESSKKKTPKTSSVESHESVNGNKTCFDASMQLVTTGLPDHSEMEITLKTNDHDMEMTLEKTPNEKRKSTAVLEPLPLTSSVQRKTPGKHTPVSMKESLSTYIDKIAESSPSFNRETQDSTGARRSWGQSVQKDANNSIDKINVLAESKKVLSNNNKLRQKVVSSDESDNEHEKNSFVDDEVEVGSETTITESEIEYLKMNEVADDGESLGSQDSNELEEQSDEENESFITDEDVPHQYDLDSDEERIENPKPRKSRIIEPSSSEDEKKEVLNKSPKTRKASIVTASPKFSNSEDDAEEETVVKIKTPRKSLKSRETEQSTNENLDLMAIDKSLNKSKAVTDKTKSKRKRESYLNESVTINSKRAKVESLNDDQMDDEENHSSSEQESSAVETQEVKKQKSKKSRKVAEASVDIETVLSKCEQLMSAFRAEKKVKTALKREKKIQKLKLKKEQESSAQKSETLDSSNGSNKENLAKKKKNKQKKQKHVDDAPEQKEDMATSVAKAQDKAELKRQKKRAKKLLKQANQPTENEENVVTDNEKKSKQPKSEVKNEVTSKKLKKTEQGAAVEEKIMTKKKHVEVVKDPIVVEKKSKKRKFAEAIEDEEKPQSKKKLNILQQIEGRDNFVQQHAPKREPNKKDRQELSFPVPLASQKLKKIIPENVEIQKRKKKKKSGSLKTIPEPTISPPKPVWTSSGIFFEEPKTPFKFTSTQYVPIKTAASSTNFGVVMFDGKKSKKASQQPQDFKTQAMLSNKNRDGSMKNMRGLLGQRNTF